MKRIEDIRPGKKRTQQSEPTSAVFTADDFYAEAPLLQIVPDTCSRAH